MKTRTLFLTLFILLAAALVTACALQPAAAERQAITDYAGLVKALEAAGAKVEPSDPVTQTFLGPEGQVLRINGQDIQVFEYTDEAAAGQDAQTISPDGGSTTTAMITWMDAPHFYRIGKLIILYVGSDAGTTQLLESLLGAQFAGR